MARGGRQRMVAVDLSSIQPSPVKSPAPTVSLDDAPEEKGGALLQVLPHGIRLPPRCKDLSFMIKSPALSALSQRQRRTRATCPSPSSSSTLEGVDAFPSCHRSPTALPSSPSSVGSEEYPHRSSGGRRWSSQKPGQGEAVSRKREAGRGDQKEAWGRAVKNFPSIVSTCRCP